MNGNFEQLTIETYDKHAKSWAGDHSDHTVTDDSRRILALYRELLPNGSVIEIGAGGGTDGAFLHEAGYDYYGTDAAQGMVLLAQRRYPELIFEKRSAYELASLQREFDGFWANAVLLHIPKEQIDKALAALNKVTRHEGVGFISLKDGTGEVFERRIVGERPENRLFSFWIKEEFEAVLSRNGFTVVDYRYRPLNERSKWHWFFVRKVSSHDQL